jgi:hypothetical protein
VRPSSRPTSSRRQAAPTRMLALVPPAQVHGSGLRASSRSLMLSQKSCPGVCPANASALPPTLNQRR